MKRAAIKFAIEIDSPVLNLGSHLYDDAEFSKGMTAREIQDNFHLCFRVGFVDRFNALYPTRYEVKN
jgi:hypothetical protein